MTAIQRVAVGENSLTKAQIAINQIAEYLDLLSVSNINATVWTAYSPTLSSGSGTLTSAAVSSAAYQQIGKTVLLRSRIAITTNGTSATDVRITLPTGITPIVNGTSGGHGRDIGVSGKMLSVSVWQGTPGFVTIVNYDNTYPGADGASLNILVIFEAT